jgi:hypothetical protein
MKKPVRGKSIGVSESAALLALLMERFEAHRQRHPKLTWQEVRTRLEANPEKMWSISEMERTGGAPDVVGRDVATGALVIMDCASETPKGRVSLCYDAEALASRKENKPEGSAMAMAQAMGIELLCETEYFELQRLGDFDLKTSSWLKTPSEIRTLGGAIFGDRRFGRVFIYHNGASSYYAARGFRGRLTV